MVRVLSIHADYRCRHAGACCTAGWPIPVDEGMRTSLEAAVRAGRLATAHAPAPRRLFVRSRDGRASITQHAGACVFYESRSTGLCTVHRQLGEDHLPPSCRHFPRIALLDARGVSITLSHYCPTAARLLFRAEVPLEIVENPPAFPADGHYEGLDARAVLPPLLRPGLLWDHAGYSRWEREAIRLLARETVGPEQALEALGRVALEIEGWKPDTTPLAAHVSAAFARLDVARAPASRWGPLASVVKRYLAAKIFASWVPYRSERLAGLVSDLSATHQLLVDAARGRDLLDAIRTVDLRVVHGRELSVTTPTT